MGPLWLTPNFPIDVIQYIDRYLPWANPIIQTSEIIYSNRDFLKKYKDSNILIIGGGASTLSFDWSKNFEEFDFIWSCNHYFQCWKLYDIRVDLVMIMPGVNLCNLQFLNKINKDNTLCGFEVHDKWMDGRLNNFYDKNKMFFSMSKMFSILGIGSRMVILAAELGVRKISFIGFDGYYNNIHAFEKNKKKWPSGINDSNAKAIYTKEYDELWNYMIGKFPATKIISIDKDNILHEKLR